MNNFVFSQDPLLFQSYQAKSIAQEDYDIKQKQLNDMLNQYKQIQQRPIVQEKDHLAELDALMKGLRKEVTDDLSSDTEYMQLNNELQSIIQEEIMSNIRWKVNSNPKAVENINKQIRLINQSKEKSEKEERKNLAELNDYMKNYSTISFNEYKKIKNKKHENR